MVASYHVTIYHMVWSPVITSPYITWYGRQLSRHHISHGMVASYHMSPYITWYGCQLSHVTIYHMVWSPVITCHHISHGMVASYHMSPYITWYCRQLSHVTIYHMVWLPVITCHHISHGMVASYHMLLLTNNQASPHANEIQVERKRLQFSYIEHPYTPMNITEFGSLYRTLPPHTHTHTLRDDELSL